MGQKLFVCLSIVVGGGGGGVDALWSRGVLSLSLSLPLPPLSLSPCVDADDRMGFDRPSYALLLCRPTTTVAA